MNDADLKFLGRLHDVREAKAALDAAQTAFRPRFARSHLCAAEPDGGRLARGIERGSIFGTEHLSLYQLTIEEATPFAVLHRTGALVMPDDDRAAELYETTQEMTEEAGLPAYEISNHARPGAECRHNLLYWRYGDYAGFGPGAHGRLQINGKRLATVGEKLPERWRDKAARQGHGYAERNEIAPQRPRANIC